MMMHLTYLNKPNVSLNKIDPAAATPSPPKAALAPLLGRLISFNKLEWEMIYYDYSNKTCCGVSKFLSGHNE